MLWFGNFKIKKTKKNQVSEISISGITYQDLCPMLQSRIETVEDFARIATVVTFEKNGGEEAKNLKLVTLVKDGKMTPERAVKLMDSFHLAKKDQGTNALTEALDHVYHFGKGYKLYNKDSRNLSEIPAESVQTVVLSPPYALGQESILQGL